MLQTPIFRPLSSWPVFALLLLGCSGANAGEVKPAADGTLRMQVTERGFEPNEVKVKAGQPLKLLITRKTDQTCAKEIVIDEYAINVKLPLNQEVAVAFTPKQTGKLKYGCGMDKMVSGVLFVE